MQSQIEQATSELRESWKHRRAEYQARPAHRSAARNLLNRISANMSHGSAHRSTHYWFLPRWAFILDTRQEEWLEHVRRACDNLLMLVNDVWTSPNWKPTG